MKYIQWPRDPDYQGRRHTYHWCPACERLHIIPDEGWEQSGPDETRTYTPSFLHSSRDKNRRCHFFITHGRLLYLADSWHGRNDTVDLPDIPAGVLTRLTEEVFKR